MGKKTLLVTPKLRENIAEAILYLRRKARGARNMKLLVGKNSKLISVLKHEDKECQRVAKYFSNILKRTQP